MSRAFDLGDLGFALCLTPQSGTIVLPHPVCIVDRSGSMGRMAHETVATVIPNVLVKCGWPPEHRATVITFDSQVERLSHDKQDPRVCDLKNISAGARGGTSMAPLFPVLERAINELPSNMPVSILCISDGELQDTTEAVQAAGRVQLNRTGSITAVSVRLGNGNADTRALMCVAQLATTGTPRVLSATGTRDLPELLRHEMVIRPSARLVGSGLRRVPGDAPSNELTVTTGVESFVLVDALEGLVLDGVPLAIQATPMTDETPLRNFLEGAHAQLRVLAVAGTAPERLARSLDWFDRLAERLVPKIDGTVDLGVLGRVRQLQREIATRRASVMSKFAELRNQGRVARLSSVQQAAFVNGTLDKDSACAKALARRVERLGDDLDYDRQCRDAIRDIPDLSDAPGDSEVSFLSQETPREMLSAARELAGNEHVTAIDVMPIVGGLGVCFDAPLCQAPDPWLYRVNRVYFGTFYLAESDLRAATMRGTVLQYPGLGVDAPVTGVAPIHSLDPEAYNAYTRGTVRRMADLQASLTIRGLLAPLPFDGLARDAATLLQACRQPDVPDEPRQRVVDALRDTVHHAMSTYAQKSLAPLAADLVGPCPRVWLTGDRDVSSALKPLAVLLCHPDARDADRATIQRAMRAIYGLAALRASRFVDDRPGQLAALIGIDSESMPPLAPLFQPDVPFDDQQFTVDVDACAARALALEWLPDHDALARPVVLCRSVDQPYTDDLDPGRMRLWAAVESLSAGGESDVVDKDSRVLLWPDYLELRSWIERLAAIATDSLRLVDQRRRAAKGKAEEADRARRLVIALIDCPPDRFVDLLNGADPNLGAIPSHQSLGFSDLQEALLDGRPCRARKFKILTVVLARDKEMNVVWADGNVLVASAATFHRYQQVFEAAGGDWGQLARIRQRVGLYRYRASGVPNRHGHSDALPSYRAYNYVSLEAFKEGVDPEVFADYVQKHINCCGLGQKK